MNTIIDYVANAEIPLISTPTSADALTLASLANVDFHALPGPRSPRGVSLRELAQASSLGVLYAHSLQPRFDRALLDACGSSLRTAHLRAHNALARTSIRPLAQFAALTLTAPSGTRYVVFRATDASPTGWIEDVQFGLTYPTTTQKWALRYLAHAVQQGSGPLWVIGHSKGANLALYAAAHLPPEATSGIVAFDPPGFLPAVVSSGVFEALAHKTRLYCVPGSWVSPLFTQPLPPVWVEASWPGPLGHNPYSWHVAGEELKETRRAPSLSGRALGRALDVALRIRAPRIAGTTHP